MGDDTFVDWYLHITLEVFAHLSLVQAVSLFHLITGLIYITDASKGGLAHVFKNRLGVHVVRVLRSQCEVHEVNILYFYCVIFRCTPLLQLCLTEMKI